LISVVRALVADNFGSHGDTSSRWSDKHDGTFMAAGGNAESTATGIPLGTS
jgi:hypothetical protein